MKKWMNIVGCYCVLNILLSICVFTIGILKHGLNFSRSSGSELKGGQEEREQPVGADWGYGWYQAEFMMNKAYLATTTVLIWSSSGGEQVFN